MLVSTCTTNFTYLLSLTIMHNFMKVSIKNKPFVQWGSIAVDGLKSNF